MIAMSRISFQAMILLLEQASVVRTLVLFRRCNARSIKENFECSYLPRRTSIVSTDNNGFHIFVHFLGHPHVSLPLHMVPFTLRLAAVTVVAQET